MCYDFGGMQQPKHEPHYPERAEYETGEYWVSLKVENKDSMTHFSTGDEVVVYFDGNVAESYPMQINTVYAITLKTPADRTSNDQS